jgi:hypothetical protein
MVVGQPEILRFGAAESDLYAETHVRAFIDRALDVRQALRFLDTRGRQAPMSNGPMSDTKFTAEILGTEVVVTDVTDGYIYRFSILSNGTVSLHGPRIKHPAVKREASRSLFEAHNAPRVAFGRSQTISEKGRPA